ncbi:hypothetical protein VP01_33g7 [Puccinia sorghi]|uniref:Uncharacterized protein n=1 Tax=Puccinia sorghi TaxID=27349 RepID=A0A0L6UWP6_9BASI|nr:hypothetical protein VP01_33g7 [Puccinia sorghi]
MLCPPPPCFFCFSDFAPGALLFGSAESSISNIASMKGYLMPRCSRSSMSTPIALQDCYAAQAAREEDSSMQRLRYILVRSRDCPSTPPTPSSSLVPSPNLSAPAPYASFLLSHQHIPLIPADVGDISSNVSPRVIADLTLSWLVFREQITVSQVEQKNDDPGDQQSPGIVCFFKKNRNAAALFGPVGRVLSACSNQVE